MWKTIKITTLKYCILKTALLLPNLQLFSYFFKKQSTCEGLECSLGGGNGNSLQYSCQENPMDRGAWWTAVHGVSKSWTDLKWLSMHRSMISALISLNRGKGDYQGCPVFSGTVWIWHGDDMVTGNGWDTIWQSEDETPRSRRDSHDSLTGIWHRMVRLIALQEKASFEPDWA